MATQYIKYAKKCEKSFFPIVGEGGMVPFGQGVATLMIWVHLKQTKTGNVKFPKYVSGFLTVLATGYNLIGVFFLDFFEAITKNFKK